MRDERHDLFQVAHLPVTVTNGQMNLRFYTTNATSIYYGYAAVVAIDIVSAGP